MAGPTVATDVRLTIRFRPSSHYIQVVSTSSLPDPRVRPAAVGVPGTGGLVDRHGRVATDLRVSLTDRCNLRCSYCMPPEGLDWLPKPDVLTDDEVRRLFAAIDSQPMSCYSNKALVDPVLFRVLYGAGLRVSEALNLTLSDVDTSAFTVLSESCIFIGVWQGSWYM